jgi:hypothetical protein
MIATNVVYLCSSHNAAPRLLPIHPGKHPLSPGKIETVSVDHPPRGNDGTAPHSHRRCGDPRGHTTTYKRVSHLSSLSPSFYVLPAGWRLGHERGVAESRGKRSVNARYTNLMETRAKATLCIRSHGQTPPETRNKSAFYKKPKGVHTVWLKANALTRN